MCSVLISILSLPNRPHSLCQLFEVYLSFGMKILNGEFTGSTLDRICGWSSFQPQYAGAVGGLDSALAMGKF